MLAVLGARLTDEGRIPENRLTDKEELISTRENYYKQQRAGREGGNSIWISGGRGYGISVSKLEGGGKGWIEGGFRAEVTIERSEVPSVGDTHSRLSPSAEGGWGEST